MDPALAIGLVVVVAAFLGWWLWAARRRRRRDPEGAAPRDAWDALNRGIDPSELDDLDGVEPDAAEQPDDAPGAAAEPDVDAGPR